MLLTMGGVVASLRVGVVYGLLYSGHLVTIRAHVLFSEGWRGMCIVLSLNTLSPVTAH